MNLNKKKILVLLLMAAALFTAYKLYSNRVQKNIGKVQDYAIGAVSTSVNGDNSTLLLFDDNLDRIEGKKISVGGLSSEYAAPLRKEKDIYLPSTGDAKRENILMVKIESKTGEIDYFKGPKDVSHIDNLFSYKDKIYYSSNLNFSCSLHEMNLTGSEEKAVNMEGTLIGNGGVLEDGLFLIAHSVPIEGVTSKEGTKIVFYDENLEKQKEFYSDEFVHRGPSIVHNNKIYFMSSNSGEEDKCIYFVDSDGNFGKIPLKYLVYRIESTAEGLLLAGGDEKSGSYILIKDNGELLYYGMKEEGLLQMKWIENCLYTLDRLENSRKAVLRKYKLEKDEMIMIQEKEIDHRSTTENIRSIF